MLHDIINITQKLMWRLNEGSGAIVSLPEALYSSLALQSIFGDINKSITVIVFYEYL